MILGLHRALADSLGVILLSVNARDFTWDAILALGRANGDIFRHVIAHAPAS